MLPNEFVEGRGMLWHEDNPVMAVDYHLAMPQESHFLLNPLGKLKFDEAQVGGFILIRPQDEPRLTNGVVYTLQLQDHSKRIIEVKRKYKNTTHNGHPRLAFWVVERELSD